MKPGIFLKNVLLFIFLALCIVSSVAAQQINRSQFYKAMASKNVDEVDQQIAAVKQQAGNDKEAYEGALLMKKADLLKAKKDKLKVFKEGREKLERMIAASSKNAEFRFLRLQIQENAPKILGYKKNLEEDKNVIVTAYGGLSEDLKQAIQDYTKQSQILKPADL